MENLKEEKGIAQMNGKSKEELKELRKNIIEFTRTLIAKGFSYKMKMDALAQEYDVSVRQAKKYITYTLEDIRKRKQESYSKEFDEVLIKLDYLYSQNIQEGNLKDALSALNQLIKLRGYEAPKALLIKQETTVKTDLSHLKPEELKQIQALLTRSELKVIDISPALSHA